MERGYVKLYRKTLDSGIIRHARAWQFLSWCLLRATHRPYTRVYNGAVFALRAGQLVASATEACAALGMTPKELGAARNLLERAGLLESRGTSVGTVFSLCDWQAYQQTPESGGQAVRPADEGPGANGGQTPRARSLKDIQEQKNRKEIHSLSAPAAPDADAGREAEVYRSRKKRLLAGRRLEDFNRFWQAFAFPKGKAEAADAWLDIPVPDGSLVERIIAAAEKEAAARPGLIASGRAPKWAQGWIAGRRWEDGTGHGVSPPPKTLDDILAEQGGAP